MKKDIFSKFSKHTKNVIDKANLLAIQKNAKEITNYHLLDAIRHEKGSVGLTILKEVGYTKKNNLDFKNIKIKTKNLPFSKKLKETFKQATKIAAQHNYPYVGTEHLVYAIIRSRDKKIRSIIHQTSKKAKQGTRKKSYPAADIKGFEQMPDFIHSMQNGLNNNLGLKKESQNALSRFAQNLNDQNLKKDSCPVIGRERELERLISVLLRKNKNNPVLVGEPGVGKTAIVSALAQEINQGRVPMEMNDKIIWEIDLSAILSGTSFRGEFEQRMKDLITYASKQKKVILFIDEIHNLMGAGNAIGSMDAANILKPALAKGDLKIIGATTFGEYKKYIEKDPALERRFQPIHVEEPNHKETKKIILGIKENYEKYHNVSIDNKAIDSAITLSKRYINDRFLPDKAIDLIDEAQAYAKANAMNFETSVKIKECFAQREELMKTKENLIKNNDFSVASELKKEELSLNKILNLIKKEQNRRKKLTKLRITEEDIKKIISQHTGIPQEQVDIEAGKLLKLQNRLNKILIGQKNIVQTVTKTIQRSFSGLNEPNRPLGSFLLMGPTGVGKTYLAKNLAQTLFKKPGSFVRIDMSEFGEKYNVSRLIGAPAGYIGFEEGGKLTESVRKNPYSLILFDEIEKGHPEIFNIFLQILEDGILTDAGGRTVNFKNTIIVFTSNIGGEEFLNKSIGFSESGLNDKKLKNQQKDNTVNKLRDTLLPELINRIDNILVFNTLTKKDLTKIAKIEIEKLIKRLNKKRISVKTQDKVYKHLAKISLDEKEGARKLRKNIEKLIKDPLAEVLLKNQDKRNLKIQIKESKNRIILKHQ
ncbi:MAG: AAA domain-containing protein [Candidatus Moranbacteria bacterium]|nr:AAA domain-containing protein [Candidatus Moranbacteria bacterium]